MKKTFYILLSLGVTVILGNYVVQNYHTWQQRMQPIEIHGTVVKKPQNLTNFNLTTRNGELFDDSKLIGNWSVMFFGYTRCPDICPMTLSTLSNMYKILQDNSHTLPKMIFVSIDPEHDNSEQVTKYSQYFNNNFIGLTGSPKQVSDLTRSLGVVVQKVKLDENGEYTAQDNQNQSGSVSEKIEKIDDIETSYIFDHSSTLYVINPKGQLQAILTAPHKAEILAEDITAIIKKYS